LLACLAAPLVAQAACFRPRLTAGIGILALATGGYISWRMIRDQWALERTWAIDATAGTWLLGLVAAAALVGLPWRAAAVGVCAGLLGLSVGWALALDAVQLRAPYQTTYWYGTTGTTDAVAWVDAHISPDQTYMASKEVAIRTRAQRYVDQDNLVYYLNSTRGFDGTWADENLRALVLWERDPDFADLFRRAVPTTIFRETARFGDYVIYEPG
jgi:hypothetical protein